MFLILNNLNILLLLFYFIHYILFIKSQQSPNTKSNPFVCANKGRFLNIYCLADYNCNNLNNKNKVCIRGLCCTQTKIKKEMVNKRTAEDRGKKGSRPYRDPKAITFFNEVESRQFLYQSTISSIESNRRDLTFIELLNRSGINWGCPKNTFNVGIKCLSTKDCQIKANLNLKAPFSLLECSKQIGMCCTNENYLKPLMKGKWCLNWGKALGKECTKSNECKSVKRPQAACVDGQCCTRPRKIISDKEDEEEGDLIPQKSEEEEEEVEEDVKEEEEEEEEEKKDGRNKRKKQDEKEEEEEKYEDDFEGLESVEEDWEGVDRDKKDDQYVDDIDSDNQKKSLGRELGEGRRICRQKGLSYKNVRRCSRYLTCGNKQLFSCISGHCCLKNKLFDEENEDFNNGRLPSAPFGFCLGTRKYKRFIGRLCSKISDCPTALDVNRKSVPIRCLRAFCFDGTPSRTQCISQRDCPNFNRQICENGICCSPNIDQKQCLPGSGQCNNPLLSLSSGAGCKLNFYCVPPGVCCECRFGMPQKGIKGCTENNQCKSGYKCEKRNGYCCPRCPEGKMPFGTCYKGGKCSKNYFCSVGNICCEKENN
uniref:EB domain-containing protein n=1 Tax=Meloidogyne hapla TaxID=6305 RepID=A0A1I8BH74_MELHA